MRSRSDRNGECDDDFARPDSRLEFREQPEQEADREDDDRVVGGEEYVAKERGEERTAGGQEDDQRQC